MRSLGVLAAVGDQLGIDLVNLLSRISEALVLVALAGVGLLTSLPAMRRTGARPFVLGLAVATVVSLGSLGLIVVMTS